MANTKSAIKRIRRISRQTQVNRSRKSKFRKDKKEAIAYLPKLNSDLMRIAKTGVVKKQNASRNVSRITKKINSL